MSDTAAGTPGPARPPEGADAPIRAAGAVVWRRGFAGYDVVLVHRPKYDDWSLPKGKLDPGEHVLTAAVREVEEESGVRIRLGRPLPTQRYPVAGRAKEVRYWTGHVVAGELAPDNEVDQAEWLRVPEALDRLTWERDQDIVRAFADGPVDTVPVLLLRHGDAVPRQDWPGTDADRPLDELGRRQADVLVDLLSCYDVRSVLSSETRRTIDTVRPYATARGLDVGVETLFGQEVFSDAPDEALDRAATIVRTARVPTVICTHRPVLPWLVSTLFRDGDVPTPTDTLAPGAFWVLHLAAGRVVAVEQHAP